MVDHDFLTVMTIRKTDNVTNIIIYATH